MFKFIFLFVVLILNANADICVSPLDDFPVLSGGRERPLGVFAHESLLFMTGKSKFGEMGATETFCRLSFNGKLNLPIKVEHVHAKNLLGLIPKESSMDALILLTKSGLITKTLTAIKENSSYRKELVKITQRLDVYQKIARGEAWTVPVVTNNKLSFETLRTFAQGGSGLEKAKAQYLALRGDGYKLELNYQKAAPYTWALLFSLLSLSAFVLFRSQKAGTILAVLTLLIQIAAMAMRVMISGRAPVTNMYETVMFSGFGALVLGMIISILKKERTFVLAGLAFNIMTLFMMKFANSMLDPAITPLVPVLRDNLWLSTHVTTVILSYAAFALSWILANSVMIRERFFRLDTKEKNYNSGLIYTCLKFGVILLAFGIFLGGVWADYSWGRFWGWDPKETWSLIVLLIYMAILHGKSTSWVKTERFIPLVAVAFLAVMMAWFGVNYILASGLHSYGFSEGGAMFLGLFCLIQIGVVIVCFIPKKNSALTKLQAAQ